MDRFVFLTMFFACCSATTGYCTGPIIKTFITYFYMEQPFPYELPLNATYFIEYKYFPLYPILYLSQGYNSILSGMQNVIVDTFFFGSCINICAHFEILRHIINDVKVKEFVEYHQKVLDLAEKINEIFSIVIFQEYLILSLIFCVIGFQVVISEDLIHSVPMMFHGTAALINLLIYSYGGERIMDHANRVCVDCYKVKKDYLIIMMRTKHEYKVKSMMYHASLPTFSLIMGRTMSMITLFNSEWSEITEDLKHFVTTTMGFAKFIFILNYRKEIYGIIAEVKELNSTWISKDQKLQIENANKLDRTVFLSMFGPCFIAVSGYIVIPMIKSMIICLIFGEPFPFDLAFNVNFFYDTKKVPAYVVTYLIQCYNCYLTGFLNLLIDTTFFGICMNICAHFEILKIVINELEVKEFVDYHQKILDLAKYVNKLFSPIIFGEYLVLSVLFSVLALETGISKSFMDLIPILFHGMASLMDLMIYSYGGQNIMDCASEICKECYNVDNNYLIIMLRTKRELKMESLMYHASLPMCSLIMGRNMSLITLMKAFL
ncbi:odorant receptor 45a-like [Chironomus tepperi]|uniref:odorant receptor 45a-like n=1 Tax=Chironomus tepperi TaxID=113505 RepID=UPI00391FBDED